MRASALFVAGLVVGSVIQGTFAQTPASQPAAVRINHVAISVPDVAQALTYYGEKFGFREVVRNANAQGLQSAYIQVSRDTFIELQQSNAQRPVGLNHFGVEVQDIKGAVAAFRGRGLTVSEPGAPSAFTGGILANITDASAGRIELSEQPPEGKLRKATESWK